MGKLLLVDDLDGNKVIVNEKDITLVVSTGADTCDITIKPESSNTPSVISADIAIADLVTTGEDLFAANELSSGEPIALNRTRVFNATAIQSNAKGTITFTGGAGTVTDITIDSVSIFDTGTAITGASLTALATNTASAINSFTSTPNYTATVDGTVVTVSAVGFTEAVNDEAITVTVTSTLTTDETPMTGGQNDSTVYYDNGGSVLDLISIDKSLVQLTTY
jgi:hypothetical protein